MSLDETSKGKQYSSRSVITIEGPDQVIQINKKDLVFKDTGDHEHLYVPDFTDETEDYIAIQCTKSGCIQGRLVRKDSKDFTKWLEKHRTKS